MIKDLKVARIIRPIHSPWNFPMVIVRQKNNEIWLCIEYRGLNVKTVGATYPIPATEEIFDNIVGVKSF